MPHHRPPTWLLWSAFMLGVAVSLFESAWTRLALAIRGRSPQLRCAVCYSPTTDCVQIVRHHSHAGAHLKKRIGRLLQMGPWRPIPVCCPEHALTLVKLQVLKHTPTQTLGDGPVKGG